MKTVGTVLFLQADCESCLDSDTKFAMIRNAVQTLKQSAVVLHRGLRDTFGELALRSIHAELLKQRF